VRKRWLCCGLLAAVVVIGSCAPMVLLSANVPQFKSEGNKALAVIVRTIPKSEAAYNSDKMSIIYVDGVFGSVNSNNSVTQVAVDAGTHYLMARIDNTATVKLKFNAGRVYYFVQKVSSLRVTAPTPGSGAPAGGLTRVQTTLDCVSPEEFSSVLKSAGNDMRFAKYAPAKPLNNMEPMAKKAHIAAYEFRAAANPELARRHLAYPGY
jgi:hypothetical protein